MWREHEEERIWRVYVTDALRLTAENAAKIGGGSVIQKRWIDIVESADAGKDNRSADEIIADVIERSGIELI